MKTGEGKTDVCAAIASVMANRNPNYAVHIVTSSRDRAAADWEDSKKFIEMATGKEPIKASDGLNWGSEGAGIVYAQVRVGGRVFHGGIVPPQYSKGTD